MSTRLKAIDLLNDKDLMPNTCNRPHHGILSKVDLEIIAQLASDFDVNLKKVIID